MPSLTPTHRFLLDENVRIELFKFLTDSNFDVKQTSKGNSDKQVSSLSKTENRILVTNDQDFTESTTDKIFSVVWIRVPQSEPKTLTESFNKLLKGMNNFSGKLIVLKPDAWDEFPLPDEV